MVMSEPAYLVFSLLAILLFQRYRRSEFARWYDLLLIGLVLVCTTMIRLMGLTLVAALLLDLVLNKRWKEVGLLLLVSAAGLGLRSWMETGALTSVLPTGAWGYTLGSSLNIQRIGSTLWDYLNQSIPQVTFGLFGPSTYAYAATLKLTWAVDLVKYLLLLVLPLGALRTISRKSLLFLSYPLLYMLVLTLKRTGIPGAESHAEPRYLIPLLPFFYLYILNASGWFSARARKQEFVLAAQKWTPIGLVGLVLVFSLGRGIDSAIHPISDQIPDLSAGTAWIAANTPDDAIVMCRNPVSRYLYAQRHTLDHPDTLVADDLVQYIERNNITHILLAPRLQVNASPQLDDYQAQFLLPLLENDPGRYRLVFAEPDEQVLVFEVTSGQ